VISTIEMIVNPKEALEETLHKEIDPLIKGLKEPKVWKEAGAMTNAESLILVRIITWEEEMFMLHL
jgi:hypothetical protein